MLRGIHSRDVFSFPGKNENAPVLEFLQGQVRNVNLKKDNTYYTPAVPPRLTEQKCPIPSNGMPTHSWPHNGGQPSQDTQQNCLSPGPQRSICLLRFLPGLQLPPALCECALIPFGWQQFNLLINGFGAHQPVDTATALVVTCIKTHCSHLCQEGK